MVLHQWIYYYMFCKILSKTKTHKKTYIFTIFTHYVCYFYGHMGSSLHYYLDNFFDFMKKLNPEITIETAMMQKTYSFVATHKKLKKLFKHVMFFFA